MGTAGAHSQQGEYVDYLYKSSRTSIHVLSDLFVRRSAAPTLCLITSH
jgi:hypothetical protein